MGFVQPRLFYPVGPFTFPFRMNASIQFVIQPLIQKLSERNFQTPPKHSLPFYIGSHRCGVITPKVLSALRQSPLQNQFDFTESEVRLIQKDLAGKELEDYLATLARKLHDAGLFFQWRNELLDLFDLDTGEVVSRVERGLFRLLGLKTQAVYAVGMTPEKEFLLGLRSHTKAVDPGLWDTLAAGLIAAGESPETAILRELGEEAGLTNEDVVWGNDWKKMTVTRQVQEGWMHEECFCRVCTVINPGCIHNVDSEVEKFQTVDCPRLLEHIEADKMPSDTALAVLKTAF